MLRIRKISDIIGKQVFTDVGDLFGVVEEANLSENKVDGWRIKVSREMMALLGGARGVIIPNQFVRAIGDILIINKSVIPVREIEEKKEAEVEVSEEV